MPPRRRAQCILAVFGGPQKYLHPHLATDRVPGQCQGSMGIGYCTYGANLARLKNRPRFPRKRMEERDRAGRWVSLPMKKGRRVLVESKTKLKINHWRLSPEPPELAGFHVDSLNPPSGTRLGAFPEADVFVI